MTATAEVEPAMLKRAFGSFATGITIVTGMRPDGEPFGLTASSFQAVSLAPPLVLYNVQRGAASLNFLAESRVFCANVLRHDQAWMARQFAERRPDRFSGVEYTPGLDACPLIEGALATFECRLWNTYDGGDHVIVIGNVVRQHCVEEGEPLVYFRGGFLDRPAAQARA